METEIDPIDRKILRILMQDGRASYSYIAKETKLSDVAVKKRIDKLLSRGIIKRITAEVDRKKLGYKYSFFVLLKVDATEINMVFKKIQEHPMVLEAHLLIGDYPILVKGIAESVDDIKRFIEELGKIEGVMEVKTYISLEESEKIFSLPAKIGQRVLG